MGTPYIPPTFIPPKPEDIQGDPAYQFRLKAGTDALNRAAAAKGVLRTGGTLQDILKYGQDYGAQEYENTYDRAMKLYGIQAQNAMDKWKSDWEQYVFANTPRGGGGGRGYGDIPPPPDAPDSGPPDPDSNLGEGQPLGGGGRPRKTIPEERGGY